MKVTAKLTTVLLATSVAAFAGCASGDEEGGGSENSPASPTQLAVATLDGGAHMTWKDNAADEENYMVERMQHPDGNWDVLATLPANSTQHHDAQALKSGTTYMYRVMAMGKGGTESKFSAEVTWMAP